MWTGKVKFDSGSLVFAVSVCLSVIRYFMITQKTCRQTKLHLCAWNLLDWVSEFVLDSFLIEWLSFRLGQRSEVTQ